MRAVKNSCRLFKRFVVGTASACIADPGVIIISGTHHLESPFADSQQAIAKKFKPMAPSVAYDPADAGATTAARTAGCRARHKIICDLVQGLDYSAISCYKAMFRPNADLF